VPAPLIRLREGKMFASTSSTTLTRTARFIGTACSFRRNMMGCPEFPFLGSRRDQASSTSSRSAEWHLLVSQPFGTSGAAWSLWANHYRSGQCRSGAIRS
jgi:hypothetical protein